MNSNSKNFGFASKVSINGVTISHLFSNSPYVFATGNFYYTPIFLRPTSPI